MDTKKILASIAAVAMLGSTVTMSVSAESVTEPTTEAATSAEETTANATETEEESFHFNASPIAGSEGIEIIGFSGSSDEAVIPAEVNGKPVVKITKLADEGSIKKIVIPASVKQIAKDAFNNINGLESIEVAAESEDFASVDGVLYSKDMTKLILCPSANKITSLSIADTVTELEDGAVSGVEALEEISVGSGLTSVDKSLFTECPNIKKITVSASVETIDYEYIKAKTSIAEYDVAEDNTVYSSVDGVLYNKEKTVLYTYPSGKKDDKFELPATVEEITENAFEGCSEISAFTVASDNAHYAAVDGILFNKDMSELVKYPAVKEEAEYTVHDEVAAIADNAFEDCAALKKVTLGASLSELKGDPFSGTTAINEFAVSETNENLKAVDGIVYSADGKTIVKYPSGNAADVFTVAEEIEAIDSNAFANCKAIKAFAVAENNNFFSVADGVLLDKEGTTLVKYPSAAEAEEYVVNFNIKTVASGAFQSALNLKSVSVKNYETEIADGAFRDMNSDFVLCGNKDSAAKVYADANYMNFSAFEGAYSLGDVNLDGAVNALDASNILTEYANIATDAELSFTPEQTVAGDVSNDGELNSLDASYVLSYYAYTATTKDEEILSVRAFIKKMIEENNANKGEEDPSENEETKYDAVSSSVKVAEYLFEQLDNEAIKVGDILDDEKFAELAGKDSDIYKIAHSYVAPELDEDVDFDSLKPSDILETEYILSLLDKESELYATISDTEKLDAMTSKEAVSIVMETLNDVEGFEKEKMIKPKYYEYIMKVADALLNDYGFKVAYILDSDTIVINNGTGALLSVEGVVVTRNDKEVELTDIEVPSELQLDGDHITVSEKVEGYENVYSWFSGT